MTTLKIGVLNLNRVYIGSAVVNELNLNGVFRWHSELHNCNSERQSLGMKPV